jgi:hypothetical protein
MKKYYITMIVFLPLFLYSCQKVKETQKTSSEKIDATKIELFGPVWGGVNNPMVNGAIKYLDDPDRISYLPTITDAIIFKKDNSITIEGIVVSIKSPGKGISIRSGNGEWKVYYCDETKSSLEGWLKEYAHYKVEMALMEEEISPNFLRVLSGKNLSVGIIRGHHMEIDYIPVKYIILVKPAKVTCKGRRISLSYEPGKLQYSDLIFPLVEIKSEQPNSNMDHAKYLLTTGGVSGKYEMTQYEVTQQLFEYVMGYNPSLYYRGNNLPVDNVSWEEAMLFCNIVGSKIERMVRLPTAREWGNACSNMQPNFSGKEFTPEFLNCNWYGTEYWEKNKRLSPVAVGSYPANENMLYDMNGNVAEWCYNWYNEKIADPQEGVQKEIRGGDWSSSPVWCKCGERRFSWPEDRVLGCGFRFIVLNK